MPWSDTILEKHALFQSFFVPQIARECLLRPYRPCHWMANLLTACRSRDRAFVEIVRGIKQIIEEIQTAREPDTLLDTSSQEYCHVIYEHWKTLDFKGIQVNSGQRVSFLLDGEIIPNVLVGIPKYETVARSQNKENSPSRRVTGGICNIVPSTKKRYADCARDGRQASKG